MARLDELEVFVRIVDSGSLSGAARAMGVSKAHVSKRLAALEDRLGARLLQRTTRKVSLTDAGRAFYDRAGTILRDLEEAERAVVSLQSAPRGLLRMSVPVSFGHAYLLPLVIEFMQRHPELNVETSFSDRRVNLVEEGYDLAVRVGGLGDADVVRRRLAATRRFLCASPAYLEKHGTPATLADLRSHPCLLYTYESDVGVWRLQGPDGEEAVRVSGPLLTNYGDAILDATRAGLGIALLPDFYVAGDLRSGRLKAFLTSATQGDEGGIWALYPHHRHLSAKVRLFVDFLAARLGPEPPWAGCLEPVQRVIEASTARSAASQ
jgi:DNA-binding transcriptional LysR family regulator